MSSKERDSALEEYSEANNGEESMLVSPDDSSVDFEINKMIDTNKMDDVIDTRSELNFEEDIESEEETLKRNKIENIFNKDLTSLDTWKKLAIQRCGLVNDDLRRKIWPLLLEVDTEENETVPSLEELSSHTEYQQVVLDVNRSLKRFPPGIPYKQRLALQDQLTVLILRVIMKYPHLRYYQGYHDVAITFLLVVGEVIAFRIMEVLSTKHLKECMEPTMDKTSQKLNYIYAILGKVDRELHDYLSIAEVGTMFALPWYLTWFGHSLNRYKDVVRLYDFFLASPPLMSLYVAAALVIYRRKEILSEPCDMATLHCLLQQIPDNVDFEEILVSASRYYEKFPPEKLEKDVKKRIQKEIDARKQQERLRNRRNKKDWRIHGYVPHWLMLHFRNKYGILFVTATIFMGVYAYLKATEKELSVFNPWPF